MFIVTIEDEVVKTFKTGIEAKDYAFCKYCFEDIPKDKINIFNNGIKVSKSIWNNE